jgi:Domain of unknown function (DUF5916)
MGPTVSLPRRVLVIAATTLLSAARAASGQDTASPSLTAGALGDPHVIDGRLIEPAWATAPAVDAFAQTEPVEGAPPSARTTVRVLAGSTAIVIGISCEQAPGSSVSYSVRRDADLDSEDHVLVVLGPFLDGRSGYVFGVNPSGARYDGLIEPGGDDDNEDWDGIWEAATVNEPNGWSVEIHIPLHTLGFKPGLTTWHFNVERRIQRLLETNRWASAARQYEITQTSRAGTLTGLPEFSLGRGFSVRPSVTTGGGVPAPEASIDGEFQPSLDLSQRLGSNLLASVTVNTDFAETEVDTRRTNLTRFPLFFPEKRTFFLEGADIFSFGLGLDEDVIPFFSRRIGLVGNEEVPILAGAKLNGRIDRTNLGGLVVGTNDKSGVVDDEAAMAVGRVKQNIWSESSVGAIATYGDPLGRPGSWLAGVDLTYATSQWRGNRNFLVGVWGLATDRPGLGDDRTAYGFKIDYPNDRWEMFLNFKRIGRDFDPSLGFVPRRSTYLISAQTENSVRPARGPLQEMFHEFQPSVALDLAGRWESYEVFAAPVNWRFRSGDRFEVNVNPAGERLVEPFEVADGMFIPPGSYHWRRYRIEGGTAEKRRLYGQVTWWFGGFYDGKLDQIEWTGAWNPMPLITVEFTGERNVGVVSAGRFVQTLVGNRLRINVSPDLSIASYVQYDNDSDSVGVNTRLRWTFTPVGDLFVVYNHNVRELLDRWQLDSNQLLVKLQYTLRR